ncbi:hypothetical protein NX81_023475 (plasmid) [Xanthomonas vasicola]|uniref:methylamine utilization protein MauJ n=1 Tax=Xanthomonas vasicola TaxID=56459 RepID=UPI00053197B1|nr:methylamine utilization protein MauJ [Xanthomonas vasicola]AZR25134.1 hypothetical protein NX81_023475 [Xanthomonas vasicola]
MGWLTAGVASSIPWPKFDVWVGYGGEDYILRGTERQGQASSPGITVPCDRASVDDALARVYRFTSILGWFKRGFVDVSGYVWGTHPILYGDPRQVYTTVGAAGSKSFNCNHMPLIEDEPTRKALAFWREGQRLSGVHDSFAFLSFYKVIESQFAASAPKIAWINANIDLLTDRAAARVAQLRASEIDVSRHLFESGRCAVAHASLQGEIVDPDIPADRRRLREDLDIMEGLAERYIRHELAVPDEMDLHGSRNRLEPWFPLVQADDVKQLRQGGTPAEVRGLDGRRVTVSLWPDGAIAGLEAMTMRVAAIQDGVVKVVVLNERTTVLLVFVLDFHHGRVHTQLDDGGLVAGDNQPDEADVRAYATFFYRVLGNGIAELTCEEVEPIDCEVVIPVNIIPPDPNTAIEQAVERFRQQGNG